MSWTDQGGNLECECGHLWSNHKNGGLVSLYFCEAPDCECANFSEITVADRFVNAVFGLEESEALDYDCARHGKGKGPDCPTCFDSDEKTRGRYVR